MTIAVRIYPHYRKALLPHSLVCAVMTQMMPLSDDDRNECLRMAQGPYMQAYPIDTSKIARHNLEETEMHADETRAHLTPEFPPAQRAEGTSRETIGSTAERSDSALTPTRNLGYQTALAVRTESHDIVQYTPSSRAMDAGGLLPLPCKYDTPTPH